MQYEWKIPNFIEFSHLKEFCSSILGAMHHRGSRKQKKTIEPVAIFICIISEFLTLTVHLLQTNPTPQQIPYSQGFWKQLV